VIPDRAIVNHMRWMLERFPLRDDDAVLQRTPLTFDASIWELFAPLLAGVPMVITSDEPVFDPRRLADVVRTEHVTVLQVVPSMLRSLTQTGELRRCGSLRRIFCGGEPLSAQLRDEVFASSSAELCNLYGPSETTIDATYHVCDRGDRRSFVPLGRPIANASVHVLDREGGLLPPGIVGEIHIGGAPLGIGYIGQPQLTAERFVEGPDGTFFRTGDRGRLLDTGELEMLGRSDDQLKVRGFRVEPGEIETVLAAHPAVADAAVVLQRHRADDVRLVAFVVTSNDRSADGRAAAIPALQAWLRERLPAYLVPSTIAVLDRLPLTQHGKIDRARLREAPAGQTGAVGGTAPRSELERVVCAAFEAELGIAVPDIDSNFFDLGGHSLLVISLRERLIEAAGRAIDVVDVFEFPTPRRLAEAMRDRPAAADRDLVGGM
jgi:acyl-coenzyme A synthetase/AMP-(fatty) acid ligase